jgi:hypothetical protein
MSTIDARKDSSTGWGTVARPAARVVQRTLSVNVGNYKGTTGASNAGYMINAVGAGDVVQILNIPAGTLVLDVRCDVLTVGTGNLSVGDSGSGTQYMAATSCASTGAKAMAATPGSKFYASADDIRLTFASANDGTTTNQTPVIKVTALLVDMSNHAPAQTFTP